MKHTLFLTTMLAAALLGGQVFADPVVFKVSESSGTLNTTAPEAMIIVDAQKPFTMITLRALNCLTLDYQGEFVLTANMYIDAPYKGVLNITSSVPSLASAWEETFSVAEGGSITLCSAGEVNKSGSVQFFGKEADNTVKLGNTEVMFVGEVDSKDDLAMNQVGVVWGEHDVKLVGKLVKGVPEPATGSLSLLALAGLCARRRRK